MTKINFLIFKNTLYIPFPQGIQKAHFFQLCATKIVLKLNIIYKKKFIFLFCIEHCKKHCIFKILLLHSNDTKPIHIVMISSY